VICIGTVLLTMPQIRTLAMPVDAQQRVLSAGLYSPLLGPGQFFSFLILYTQSVGLLGRVMRPSQSLYLRTEQHKQNTHNRDSHALSGIRTHGSSVRASEDSSCLRPRGHCDRPSGIYQYKIQVKSITYQHCLTNPKLTFFQFSEQFLF
jgi:hypothetical protein